MNLLDRLPSGSRIAVIRLRSLGDCVLTTPALSLLKQQRPDLKISVIVEPRFAEIFANNPDVDETRESMTKQGAEPVASTPDQFAAFIRSEMAKWSAVIKAAGLEASQ